MIFTHTEREGVCVRVGDTRVAHHIQQRQRHDKFHDPAQTERQGGGQRAEMRVHASIYMCLHGMCVHEYVCMYYVCMYVCCDVRMNVCLCVCMYVVMVCVYVVMVCML